LGDDSEGAGVGRVLTDPEYLRRLGYIAGEPKVKGTDVATTAEVEKAEQAELNQPEVVPVTEQTVAETPAVEQTVAVPAPAMERPVTEESIAPQPAAIQAPAQVIPTEQYTSELKTESPVTAAPKVDQAIVVQ